jgi:hypothetical protein
VRAFAPNVAVALIESARIPLALKNARGIFHLTNVRAFARSAAVALMRNAQKMYALQNALAIMKKLSAPSAVDVFIPDARRQFA